MTEILIPFIYHHLTESAVFEETENKISLIGYNCRNHNALPEDNVNETGSGIFYIDTEIVRKTR